MSIVRTLHRPEGLAQHRPVNSLESGIMVIAILFLFGAGGLDMDIFGREGGAGEDAVVAI